MKRIAIALVLICIAGAAPAAQRCVAFSSSGTSCTDLVWYDTGIDWSATCTTGGETVTVRGVYGCTMEGASAQYATADTLGSSAVGEYCWCKMTYPLSTKWVFYGYARTSVYNCIERCSFYCVQALEDDSAFRQALINARY